jgi:hypothetical protein
LGSSMPGRLPPRASALPFRSARPRASWPPRRRSSPVRAHETRFLPSAVGR